MLLVRTTVGTLDSATLPFRPHEWRSALRVRGDDCRPPGVVDCCSSSVGLVLGSELLYSRDARRKTERSTAQPLRDLRSSARRPRDHSLPARSPCGLSRSAWRASVGEVRAAEGGSQALDQSVATLGRNSPVRGAWWSRPTAYVPAAQSGSWERAQQEPAGRLGDASSLQPPDCADVAGHYSAAVRVSGLE